MYLDVILLNKFDFLDDILVFIHLIFEENVILQSTHLFLKKKSNYFKSKADIH